MRMNPPIDGASLPVPVPSEVAAAVRPLRNVSDGFYLALNGGLVTPAQSANSGHENCGSHAKWAISRGGRCHGPLDGVCDAQKKDQKGAPVSAPLMRALGLRFSVAAICGWPVTTISVWA
jgi:hypothetical protein